MHNAYVFDSRHGAKSISTKVEGDDVVAFFFIRGSTNSLLDGVVILSIGSSKYTTTPAACSGDCTPLWYPLYSFSHTFININVCFNFSPKKDEKGYYLRDTSRERRFMSIGGGR